MLTWFVIFLTTVCQLLGQYDRERGDACRPIDCLQFDSCACLVRSEVNSFVVFVSSCMSVSYSKRVCISASSIACSVMCCQSISISRPTKVDVLFPVVASFMNSPYLRSVFIVNKTCESGVTVVHVMTVAEAFSRSLSSRLHLIAHNLTCACYLTTLYAKQSQKTRTQQYQAWRSQNIETKSECVAALLDSIQTVMHRFTRIGKLNVK